MHSSCLYDLYNKEIPRSDDKSDMNSENIDLSAAVAQRTSIAGSNRLELLLFKLQNEQTFAINVFKVKEIFGNFKIHLIPGTAKNVIGLINIRNKTYPVIDLSKVLHNQYNQDFSNSIVILTELNNHTQAFLVTEVSRIINTKWEEVSVPPSEIGSGSYVTAVTKFQDQLIEIIDVEKILEETAPSNYSLDNKYTNFDSVMQNLPTEILICDDSLIARKQLNLTIKKLSNKFSVKEFNNGKQMLDFLISESKLVEGNDTITSKYLCLISDIEMPEMDGYKLTMEIKNNVLLKNLKIVLHSSLSGLFNNNLVEKVGADYFIAKFEPNKIAEIIQEVCVARQQQTS